MQAFWTSLITALVHISALVTLAGGPVICAAQAKAYERSAKPGAQAPRPDTSDSEAEGPDIPLSNAPVVPPKSADTALPNLLGPCASKPVDSNHGEQVSVPSTLPMDAGPIRELEPHGLAPIDLSAACHNCHAPPYRAQAPPLSC